MNRFCTWLLLFALAAGASAAEKSFDFSGTPAGQAPKGWRSIVTGLGKPGEWQVLFDEVPSMMRTLTSEASNSSRVPVLAQVSKDPTDEHFPLLVYDQESFGDFTFVVRVKNVSGQKEQMAGVAFRIQDEKNYYVVRASSLGNTFRFYKYVNGERGQPIGNEIAIPSGVWHEITVECKGNLIRCLLNGKEVMPPLTDYTFNVGKIGFWTKSDSVSYFSDARISYTPRESLAKVLIKEMVDRYPRLEGLKMYAVVTNSSMPVVVASDKAADLGLSGTKVEKEVIEKNQIYYGKTRATVLVTFPLHDRNGDVVAALRVVMKPFAGQTEKNAIARAMPIVEKMEYRIRSKQELLE